MSVLPVEVLQMIFEYLSVNERKAVKLVCKEWFEICNEPRLSNREIINCLGIYQLSDTYKLLNQSKPRVLNLKFNHVDFNLIDFTTDLSFWENNGPRIRSITFEDCRFEGNVLGEIITSCDKLMYLTIRHTPSCTLPSNQFPRISGKGLVRESLQSFEIVSSKIFISQENAIQLFAVFPNLKALNIPSYLSVINNYLMASKDRIEKLKFCSSRNPATNEFHLFSKTLNDLTRLKEFSSDSVSESQQEDIEKFLFSKPLKSLEYYRRRNPTSVDSFLLELLQSNSTLEYLKINITDNLIVTKGLFEKLISSKLKSCLLHIEGSVAVEDLNFVISKLSAVHEKTVLPSVMLHLSSNQVYADEDVVSFLQCFPNLHHLQVDKITSNVLLSLLKYKKKLKSLIARNMWPGSLIDKFYGINRYAFNQLPGIERMELDKMVTRVFLKALSPDPILANLKYLKIDVSAEESYIREAPSSADLMKLADATPFLEALYVTENRNFSFVNLSTKLCTKLTRLRFLYWFGCKRGRTFLDADYRNLFSIRPSLRVLCHHQAGRINKYFYNALEKKVTRFEEERDLYTFARPKIGGITVDWLKF